MIILIIFLLGLCLGSFVNALVWRIHEQSTGTKNSKKSAKLSIMRGRSMCVHCHHVLKATDLIPVISWLSLRGKCRYCHKPISVQYPTVELLTALLFVISYIFWPYSFSTLGLIQFGFWLVFVVGFVALVVYDLKWMLLPDRIVYPLLGLAIIQTLIIALLTRKPSVLLGAALGFLAVGGLFYVLFQLSGGKWIGGGDVKLGFVLGIVAGSFIGGLLLLFIASVTGSIVSMVLLALHKVKRSSRIPFGPFLLFATYVVVVFGEAIIDWYKALIIF